jgi:uncharacterized protein YecT (DUF1311 family)
MASLGWAVLITIFVHGLLSTAAVSAEKAFDCENPKSTVEMGACLKADMDAADRELNETYNSLHSELRRSKRKALATKLARDQNNWVKHRWKNCDEEGYEKAGGGTLESIIFGDCYVRVTRERLLELEQKYGDLDKPKN